MSVQAMTRVMADSEAAGMARLVLLVMANRAGGDDDVCFASVERIAHESRVSIRTVQRSITALQKTGDLVLEGVHSRFQTNVYRVMPVGQMGGVRESPPRQPRTKPVTQTEVTGVIGSLDSDVEDKSPVRESPPSSNRFLADAILSPDSRAIYFWNRLNERDPDRWKVLTPAVLIKLGQTYGAVTLIEALSYVYEQADTADAPYPYLQAICRRIDEGASAE